MLSVTSPRLVSDMKTGSFISFVHCTPSVSRSIWKVEGTQRTIVKVQCLSISAIFLSFVILRSGLWLLHLLFDDWWKQNPTFHTSEKQRKDSVNFSQKEVVKRSFQEYINLPLSMVPLNTCTAVCFYLFLSLTSHAKSWLIGKDSDAGRDWGQEEKGTAEDEMAGWHHWLDGRESEWTPGVGDGQGGLACCDSWGGEELDTTERLNWTPSLGATASGQVLNHDPADTELLNTYGSRAPDSEWDSAFWPCFNQDEVYFKRLMCRYKSWSKHSIWFWTAPLSVSWPLFIGDELAGFHTRSVSLQEWWTWDSCSGLKRHDTLPGSSAVFWNHILKMLSLNEKYANLVSDYIVKFWRLSMGIWMLISILLSALSVDAPLSRSSKISSKAKIWRRRYLSPKHSCLVRRPSQSPQPSISWQPRN